jgi:DNA helicase-2/ATP-dependent DNA helicase PcrA
MGMDEKAKPDLQQQKAINFGQGVAVVKAAAGSGKTRVIERRVSKLLKSEVHPSDILILSHTNKAADEIRARITHPKAQKIVVGTIHSLCHRILRQYPKKCGLPKGFTVATPASLREMAKDIREAMKRNGYARVPKAAHLLAALSFSRNTGCSLAEAMNRIHHNQRYSKSILEEFAQRYQRRKTKRGLVDFDDLLSVALHLLKQNKDVRVTLRQLHRHIMVDEFQDINAMQLRIIKLLFGSPLKAGDRSLMVVGDPGQSIYGFRGARFENWASIESASSLVPFELKINYRSSPQIVAVGNVFDDRTLTKRSAATTPEDAASSTKPRIRAYPSREEEIEDICYLIEQHRLKNVPLAQQAIICRTSGYFVKVKTELEARRLPVHMVGGTKTKAHILLETLIAVFRVAANRKDIPALQVLLRTIPQVGQRRAADSVRRLSKTTTRNEFQSALSSEIKTRYPNAQYLVTAIITARNTPDLSQAVERVLDLLVEAAPKGILSQEQAEVLARQLELIQATAAAAADLREFVAILALEQQNERVDTSTDKLTLTTIHGAKGLEWDVVYLPQLEEGHIPHEKSRGPDEIAEERRMMYVAATRAKRHLYMSHVQGEDFRSGSDNSGPSRFLSLPGLASKTRR